MHDAFDFARHDDTLRSIKPKSKQAEILTLMLRDVCSCSDFIQSYIEDTQFSKLSSPALLANSHVQPSVKRMLKNVGSGVEEKIRDLSTTLVEHRRAFLDYAVITTEITAFQILNNIGSISSVGVQPSFRYWYAAAKARELSI